MNRFTCLAAVGAIGLVSSLVGCAGMSMKLEKPDPKKMACEEAANKVEKESLKVCLDLAAKTNGAAIPEECLTTAKNASASAAKPACVLGIACVEGGTRANKKSFDDCMSH